MANRMVLMRFLQSAQGEQHDVAVYDSGYEFDPGDMGALRFIAKTVMIKAKKCIDTDNGIWPNRWTEPNYDNVIPQDGSVVPLGQEPKRECMRKLSEERRSRERESVLTYIPNAESYYDAIIKALQEDPGRKI